MTRRLTHALAVLYGLVALGLIRCAAITWNNGSIPYALLLLAASVCLAVAIVHHSVLRDEIRYAHAQLGARQRVAQARSTGHDDTVAIALAEACCERWWTSAGAEHDPEHCTRKDTSA